VGSGRQDMGIWDTGDRIWNTGYGRQDMGYRIWETGYGRQDMEYRIWGVDTVFVEPQCIAAHGFR